jgi:hypothetical protein
MGRAHNPAASARRSPREIAPDYEGWYAEAALNLQRIDVARRSGEYIPGANGCERPFRAASGARLLWCWRPATGEHHYLNCDTDIFLADEEAGRHLGVGAVNNMLLRCQPPSAEREDEIATYLPTKLRSHYIDLTRRRFRSRSTSERAGFVSVDSLSQLLDTCILQRHSLSGDDRLELIALGADIKSFSDSFRYLKVIADGIGGSVLARELKANTPVRAQIQKDGLYSFIVDNCPRVRAFIGTIIIGKEHENESEHVVDALPLWPTPTYDLSDVDVSTLSDVASVCTRYEDAILTISDPPLARAVEADGFAAVFGNGRGSEISRF